jgi:predicted GNAT family acetyltransferase
MSTRIEDLADRNRLELYEDDTRVAELHYQRAREILVLEHTEVEPGRRGKGYAGQLVRAALDQAKAENRRVIVVCPYAKGWLARHPDYAVLDYTHA